MADSRLTDFTNMVRSRRCSLAHIQGEAGCGKSTRMVPEIWSLHEDDPGMTMVIIQPTEWQTALLSDFFLASGDGRLVAGLRNERLKLWSFSTAIEEVLATRKPEDIGLRVVVCIDLELSSPAPGEFLLSCLVELGLLAQRTETPDYLRYALVTLGSHDHRYPGLCLRP
jgi:hypothetical protein